MAARDHLHALPAVFFELRKQRELLCGVGVAVAGGVGNHGHAASVHNPAHRIGQLGPAVRHKAGFAFGQVAAKHLAGVFAHARLHQKARKVGARNQLGVAGVFERTFVGPLNAHFGQFVAHFLGTFAPAIAGVGQALQHGGVVGVKAQAHNVHGEACKGHRNFGAGEVGQARGFGRGHGAVLAANFVVVGQGPQLHAVGFGAHGQLLWGQGAVRDDRMAVQVGVQNRHFKIIVDPRLHSRCVTL